MLLAALSQCHMPWYLHLCAQAGIVVTAYADRAEGTLAEERDGSGRFVEATLRPRIALTDAGRHGEDAALHGRAHDLCFIVQSVNFPVACEPVCAPTRDAEAGDLPQTGRAMHRPRLGLLLLPLLILTGCSAQAGTPTPVGSPPSGLVVVTAGGTALEDGADDVPPTLQLSVSGDGVTNASVGAKLDGRRLFLANGKGGVAAVVTPMAYASSHSLEIDVVGRPAQLISFHVIDGTQVSAAAWLDAAGHPVVEVVFEHAPDRAEVAAALPSAQLTWIDSTHLRLVWSASPSSITIPAGLAAARGSALDGPLHLSLTGLAAGELRRATVPAAAPAPPGLNLMLWTVGTAASHASTQAHAQAVTILSPTGWVAEADGSLSGSPDVVTTAAATADGRPDWPLVANDFGDPDGTTQLLTSPTAEVSLISTLAGDVGTCIWAASTSTSRTSRGGTARPSPRSW